MGAQTHYIFRLRVNTTKKNATSKGKAIDLGGWAIRSYDFNGSLKRKI